MDEKQLLLRELMSALSQEHACAGWLSGWEYLLWRILLDGDDITPRDARELRQASDDCGGWIVWPPRDDSTRFVPMDEWLLMFAEWERGADGRRQATEKYLEILSGKT